MPQSTLTAPSGLSFRVVLLLAAAVFINYVDRGNLATASPLLKDELGLSNSEMGSSFLLFFGHMRRCSRSRVGSHSASMCVMCWELDC
jgi:hypothetical protein